MSTPRLPRGPRDRERRTRLEWHRAAPFAHEDAMAELLQRDARAIARELGLAGRTVRQWRERHDSDHRGPGRTLALAIRAAIEICGRRVEEALAPVRALADEWGHDLVPRCAGDVDASRVTSTAAETVRDVGSAIGAALDAVRDGTVDAVELALCDTEILEAQRTLATLRREIEALHRGGAARLEVAR